MGITIDQHQTWIRPNTDTCINDVKNNLVMIVTYTLRKGTLIIPHAEYFILDYNCIFSPVAEKK